GTLIQEDITAVAVGMMAAEHLIGIPLAVGALIAGTIVNDMAIYGAGRAAGIFPRLNAWLQQDARTPLKFWLEKQLVRTVVTTQFLPGLRFPIFGACGFFALSFGRYTIATTAVAFVWAPLVFTCAYFYGLYTLTWMGLWRWPVALLLVLTLIYAGRQHWKNVTKTLPQPD
ncbi:MAG TPA: VTT domain-containing protein, partial [Rhizomicrobium sp.]|nr:VTT domain-containing protein [Rhizomicrobium sp.]